LSHCEAVSICIEEGSEHLLAKFDFALSFDRTILIWFLERSPCIRVPKHAEILGWGCFSDCKSLSSISIESDSKLKRIESEAFQFTALTFTCVPATIQSIAADAFPKSRRVSGKSVCLVM
jgi:hypothetical protein